MFYPIHLNLQNRKCLVVGGGTVAERKVVAMLISGGEVTVICPDTTELLTFLADKGIIRFIRREFQTGDTHGYFLVCAATDTTRINTAVFEEAHEENKIALVNVVDVIPQCTFAAASVVTDGELVISISTSGKSPATSRRIREHFEEMLDASSLYTLGYENGKPVPVVNQGLPYPVYLLLEGRNCIVLYDKYTSEIERRVQLLQRCGSSVKCLNSANIKPRDFDDVFLVISDKLKVMGQIAKNEGEFICEVLDNPKHGTHSTPNMIIDENFIISISASNSDEIEKVEKLHQLMMNQFENKGYGRFIDFLGTLRPAVLKAFSTPKERAAYFENLINHQSTDKSDIHANTSQHRDLDNSTRTCCLQLKDSECSSECLFNWIIQGKMNKASELAANLLGNH